MDLAFVFDILNKIKFLIFLMHCESFMLLAKCNWVEECEEIEKKKKKRIVRLITQQTSTLQIKHDPVSAEDQ